MKSSILSGSRADYVNKFHPANLRQQNSKTITVGLKTKAATSYSGVCPKRLVD